MNTGLRTFQLSYTRNGHPLFENLELTLRPGQGLFVGGPNGCGKTSLLRVLAGFIPPTEGSIHWNLGQTYQEALHYLGHLSGFKNKLTVEENLRYNQTLGNYRDSDQPLETILHAVNLLPQKTRLAQHLSAGQKRRLALARLLAFPRPLWILDEPFTNLDESCQQWFREQLEIHLENQGLVILASHQPLHLKGKAWLQTLFLSRHV